VVDSLLNLFSHQAEQKLHLCLSKAGHEGASHLCTLSPEKSFHTWCHQNHHFSKEHFGFKRQILNHFFLSDFIFKLFWLKQTTKAVDREDAAVLIPDSIDTVFI